MGSLLVDTVVVPETECDLCTIPQAVSRDCVLNSVFANLDFKGFSDFAKDVWKRRFIDPPMSEIVGLAFWSSVVEDFQPDEDRCQRIVGLIASHYRVLFETVPTEWKDKFFSRLPDALAQSVVFSLFLAFPRSRMMFDGSYRLKLLRRMCHLVWGYVPVGVSISHWKLLLGDENVLDASNPQAPEDDEPVQIDRFSPLVKQLVYTHRFAALRYIPATRMRLTRRRSAPRLEYSSPLVDSKKGSFLRNLSRLEIKMEKELDKEKRRLAARLKSLTRQETERFGHVLIAR